MHTRSNLPDSVANGLGAASSSADSTRSGVSTEFHNFLADIEDLVKETTTLTGEELTRAKAKLSARVAAAKRSAGEMGGAIAKQARKTAAISDDYVHEQPWKAIGAGAALGLVLGFLLGRRD